MTTKSEFDAALTFVEVNAMQEARAEFETVIRNELAVADVYFVTRKGAYDAYSLIATGEVLCSSDLGIKVPPAIVEIREAGKCLAFELCTASGFHMLRAVELVLRNYWDAISGKKPHPSRKNIGAYLNQMEKHNVGTSKVIATLKQIKDLHRNPLMHPSESLTLTDAIALIGICVSAMNAMLKEIPFAPAAVPPLGTAASLPAP